MSTFKMLAAWLALIAAVAVAQRAHAQTTTLTKDDLKRRVERIAPPYPTLAGKAACACPQTGYLSRVVGYLNSVVTDHGTYETVSTASRSAGSRS